MIWELIVTKQQKARKDSMMSGKQNFNHQIQIQSKKYRGYYSRCAGMLQKAEEGRVI
jgi:hypothetical protein